MDLVKTLFDDIRSPDLSIRFSVLSRIEDLDWTEEQLGKFKELMNGEPDPDTRFHMRKILARIERQMGKDGEQSFKVAEVEELLKNPNRDDLSLVLLLEAVPKSQAPLVAMALREINWTELSSRVLPSVLKLFRKHGSFEDIASIESLCRHHDPRVLAAAVETLEKLSPDSLKGLIVPLLVNPIHGIRSRAVRLLYRWDPKEALRHFEAMLFSDDPSDRQAALFHAFFFPFNDIEPLMIKFLGIEDDPVMLQRAGFIFRANPTPDEPIRLLEAKEASRGEKRRLIDEILSGVVRSLYQAGLVKKTPEEMTIDLEEVYQRRKALQLIERLELALSSSDANTRKAAALRLADFARLGFTDAQAVLGRHLSEETDPQVKAVIESQGKAPPVKPVEAKTQEIDFSTLGPAERAAAFSNLTAASLKSIRPKIKEFLGSVSAEEKILLVRSLGRVGEKGDAEYLEPHLSDSDPAILSAAIEALQALDPEVLVPYLPKLIQNVSDDVRAAAVRAFALFDKRSALSLVEKMLFSVQPKQRNLAIFSAGHFDFPSVRETLLGALQREQDPENLRHICLIFKPHLDEDIILHCYRVFQSSQGAKRDLIENFCKDSGKSLIQDEKTKFKNVADLLEDLQKRIDAEVAREKSAQPNYALKNIQKMRQKKTESEGEGVDPSLVKFAVLAFGVGGVLTMLIWFLFLAPSAPGPATGTKPPAEKPPATTKPLDSTPQNIEGTVIAVDPSGKIILVIVDGNPPERYSVNLRTVPVKPYERGATFRGQVKPLSKDRNTTIAELIMSY